MEHDCVVDLYQSVGRSVGEQFSTEDVSQLFCKIFHEWSNADEVHAAMTKISNGDSSWTCAGHNVLDVLREMEHEREKSEKIYWDRQLLNAANNPYMMETPIHDQIHILQSSSVGKSEWSVRNVHKLRKAHRQSWARLVVDGLQSLLPPPQPRQTLKVKGQAWGYITLSDILLLVEVKYDAVSNLLCSEMLKEHYSLNVWKNLSPWQQRQAEEGLGDRADMALESYDLLHLAELPGAFRIYRFQEQCWSAVSFMCELKMLCQQEKRKLEGLALRLNMESLELLCLYIRLATLRAQREKVSYGALLAAQQSWETWPDVSSPLRAEQAALLLQSEDNEQKVESVSEIPQQAVLQLLVLTQEQERRQLIKLVQEVSLGDVQRPGFTEERSKKPSDLRVGCVNRLHQIYSSLKTQTHCEPRLQDCALHLLTHLLRLQEVQTSVLLPTLVGKSTQALRFLEEEYRAALQAQSLPNLHQLLTSDQPLESCSTFRDNTNLPQIISYEKNTIRSPEDQGRGTGRDVQASGPNERTNDVYVQAEDAPREPDVCTDCGAVMADLPYLEVLCASDTTSASNAEMEQAKGETSRAMEDSQIFEKQGSLITLAWSKPLDSDTSEEALDESLLQTTNDNMTNNIQQTICESSGVQIPEGQYCSTHQVTAYEKAINQDENRVQALVADNLLTSSTDSSNSEQQVLSFETSSDVTVSVEEDLNAKEQQELNKSPDKAGERLREPTLTEKVCEVEPVSAMERERTMRSLVDIQKKVEQRQQRDRERQLLKVQERLSIIQNRKAEEDPLGLKDRLKLLTHDLPQEDIHQQKAVVKERLEQLRRESSYILQSKRDKNTAGFKELLGPVGLHNTKIEEDTV